MKYPLMIFLCFLSLFSNGLLFSQDESFLLNAKKFEPYFPTYMGNGHFSLSSSVTGTLPAESYMIKVYDHGEKDIPRIANLPAWNEINYFNGSNWLNKSNPDFSEFKNYEQKLDMFSGTIQTQYNWVSGNKETNINVVSFISRENKNIAVIKFELQPSFSGVVRVSFPFSEREKIKRMELAKLEKVQPNPPGKWPAEWYPGFTEVLNANAARSDRGGNIVAVSQTEGRKTLMAHAIEIYYEGDLNDPQVSVNNNSKSANIEIQFSAQENEKYSFYKIISIASGSDSKEVLVNEAKKNRSSARDAGFTKLLDEHKKEWEKLWQTDIIVKGDPGYQKIIHSMMYYLLSSIDENTAFSIPPMGLATSGYYGHIFWDADTYMLPPLLFMHPSFAESMIKFRYNNLQAAKDNAKKNNYRGAMYPWESDERGEETTPFFAYQNAIKENHIVGDVALAQWQYFLATKDTAWLKSEGSAVILACAEFWESRVNYNKEKDRYEIGKVVSVSEGLQDVSNETYTNSIAKLNMEIAAKVNEILGRQKNSKWEEIAAKMLIPFDEEDQYHPIHENAPEATAGSEDFWKSVAPLLSFPLQMEMSETAKRNDLLHAVSSLVKDGPGANMGTNFLAIVAAELKDDSLFNLAIEKTVKGFLRPPFNVLAETHTNNSINFITGAGAFLQQIIFGYTGLRLTEEGLVKKYEPRLPKNITSLTLKNFTIAKEKVDIVVENNAVRMMPNK